MNKNELTLIITDQRNDILHKFTKNLVSLVVVLVRGLVNAVPNYLR